MTCSRMQALGYHADKWVATQNNGTDGGRVTPDIHCQLLGVNKDATDVRSEYDVQVVGVGQD